MDGITNWMNEHLAPLAGRMGQNKVLQAISQGMVMTMPWEMAQKCADILKVAGYNYAENYYEQHNNQFYHTLLQSAGNDA